MGPSGTGVNAYPHYIGRASRRQRLHQVSFGLLHFAWGKEEDGGDRSDRIAIDEAAKDLILERAQASHKTQRFFPVFFQQVGPIFRHKSP